MDPLNLLLLLQECGYEVVIGEAGEPALKEKVKGAVLPRHLLTDLKRHRKAIVELLTCKRCNRVSTCHEDLDVLRHPLNAVCEHKACKYKLKMAE